MSSAKRLPAISLPSPSTSAPVEPLPDDHRAAVGAVAAALAAAGSDPGAYTAEVNPVTRGLLEVHLRHRSHPADELGRGDLCGRCCVARYSPRTGRVLRLFGIR